MQWEPYAWAGGPGARPHSKHRERLALHDLRRTCARLCHSSGGELEQIQFLLGHVSMQTTARRLGCKQRINTTVNDRIGIEPKSWNLELASEWPTMRSEPLQNTLVRAADGKVS